MSKEEDAPAIQILVLGPLDIRLEHGKSIAFESVKTSALLTYLAVESARLHSRRSLAGLLWPERPDSAALANLRHTLSSLRRTLNEQFNEPLSFFNISPKTLRFNPTVEIQVDLAEFEAHLAEVDQHDNYDLPARISHLRAAVQLYHGRFMEGFSLKGCPEFEDWMLLRRENLFLQFQNALRSLAAAYEASGAWQSALSSLRQLLHFEPWDESAHRKVMALLAIHNQRSAAISQYEHCHQLLQEELGVEPEEDTVRLYEQIRQGKYTQPTIKESQRRSIRLAKPSPTPFVGRQHQLEKLHQVLRRALEGHGQVLFISGEAGCGKTSLAWEFARQAMDLDKGLLITAGRCNAVTGFEDPYLPFREMVQMLVGIHESSSGHYAFPQHLRRMTEAFPDIIKSLLTFSPDLIGSFIPLESLAMRVETFSPGKHSWQTAFERYLEQCAANPPALNPNPMADPEALTYKPIESVTRVLIELARHRPLILFLDDLQWAASGSLSLLHYLCKRLAGSQVIVLGAYRPQDIALGRRHSASDWERHPLEPVRLELQREFGEVEVDLDQPEDLSFIDALVDIEPNRLGKSFRQTLYRQTNGNPLFTLELLHNMQERGGLVPDAAGRWVEGSQLDWEKLPARVEAVITERLGRLPPNQRSLLRAASVEGEIFTAEVTARVLGLDEQQVVSWLSGSLGREQQIVSVLDVQWTAPMTSGSQTRLSHYRFNHILFQKYLYQQLDPVERSTLHEATGLALQKLYAPALPEITLQLAWHFQQAGRPAQAAEYLLLAGRQSLNLGAHSQAMAHYDRCLGLLHQLSESPQRTRLEIQVQLARGAFLLAMQGWSNPQAVQAVNQAIELLEQFPENSSDASILLALYFQADHFTTQNNMPEALERVELLLQRISADTQAGYRTLACSVAGQVFLFAGQPVNAAQYLQQAIPIYRSEDQTFLTGVTDHNVLQKCLVWKAWVQWLLGHPAQARAASRQAIEMARQQDNPLDLAMALAVGGALFYAIQNEPEQAGIYARECLNLSNRSALHGDGILSQVVLGWVQVHQGEYQSGLALLRKGLEAWESGGALTMLPLNLMLLADALSLVGQTAEALQTVGNLVEMIQRTGGRALEAYLYWLQGEIMIREQRRTGPDWKPGLSPEACFERSIEVARRQQARSLELRAATSLAACWRDTERAKEAALRLEKIYQHFESETGTQDLLRAQTLLAELSGSTLSN
jgi:DNA-binding SARP family transcriptional activator/predicted ATPase